MRKHVYHMLLLSILLVTSSCAEALAGHPEYQVKNVTWIMTHGGRLDWSHSGNNLIVYDHREADGYYDIYTMNPDGTNITPLTPIKSQGKLPQKNIGQPAWHPSGNYIVFQAEKDEHPAAQLSQTAPGNGLYNDLWVMTADGNSYYQLTNLATTTQTAVLHPQFNLAGDKLLWSETAGSTWALKVADFVVTPQPHLENIQTYQPGTQHGWYESHGFNPLNQSEVLFTATCSKGQTFYDMDIYTFDIAGQNNLKRLTNSDYWDEHAHYSPDGTVIIWMSSQGTDAVVGDSLGLKTDYWIMNADGSDQERITFFNEPGHPEYMGKQVIASDFAFSPDGSSIAVYIQTLNDVNYERIARIDFVGPIISKSSTTSSIPQDPGGGGGGGTTSSIGQTTTTTIKRVTSTTTTARRVTSTTTSSIAPTTTTTAHPTKSSTTSSIGLNPGGGGGGGGGYHPITSTTTIAPTTILVTTSTTTMMVPPACTVDADCDDGLFCNGREKCIDGKCTTGQSPCSQGQLCRESLKQCWEVVNITAASLQQVVQRPILRDKKCQWLIVYSSQEHHFTPDSSSIEITGPEEGAHGVTGDAQQSALSLGRFILVPVCIEREATTGQWSILIKTDVNDSALEETIATSFQVK